MSEESVNKVQKHKTLYTIISIISLLISVAMAFVEVYGAAIGFLFLSVIILVQLKAKNSTNIENKDS